MLRFSNLVKHSCSKVQVCCNVKSALTVKKASVATTYGLRKPQTNDFGDDDAPVEMENPYIPLPSRCCLCGVHVDYKNVQLLSQFVSSFTGLLLPRKSLPLCDKKYEEVVKAIELSRKARFMAYHTKEPAFYNDPVLHKK